MPFLLISVDETSVSFQTLPRLVFSGLQMGKGRWVCLTVSQALLLLGICLVVAGLIVALKVVPDETHKTIKKVSSQQF